MNTDTIMNNEAATTTEVPPPTVAVKVIRGDEMRRFNIIQGKSFQEIKETIAQLFGIDSGEFSLRYEDDEKDIITLSTDEELKEAIQLHKYILRFFVIPINGGHHHHPHHHPHGVASPPSPYMVAAEGEVIPSPPPHGHHHYHGRHAYGNGRHAHMGPYGGYGGRYHKRCQDKEEKEAMKSERKKWKKERKCDSSSSSSSSEDEAQKKQKKKEMRQLMKATKMSIKASWQPTKHAHPAFWRQNRIIMMQEIQLAKRLIRDQAKTSVVSTEKKEEVITTITTPAPATPITPSGSEMQA